VFSKTLRRWSQHRLAVALSLAALSFGVAAGISWLRSPLPQDHDEFSKLLSADTFAEGRLTNPTHPMWKHFESIHVIHQPSYASKYPPGPGLVLAAGTSLLKRPIVGVWLLCAIACVAFYWMLLGFVPAKWALIGGLGFAIHPNIQVVMGQCFYVETLAILGGALVCGAVPRLAKSADALAASLMAIGAMVLASSRPYEGMMLCLFAGGWILAAWWRSGMPPWRDVATSVALPFLVLMSIGLAGLGFYNYQVTGDATRLPYQVHEATYGMCPLFLWQSPGPDQTYNHSVVEEYHRGWSMDWYRRQDSLAGFVREKAAVILGILGFYLPQPAGLVICALPLIWCGRSRASLVMVALMSLVSMVAVFASPRYFAPTAPLLLLLVLWATRAADVIVRRKAPAIDIVAIILLVQLVGLGLATSRHVRNAGRDYGVHRARVCDALQSESGKHLVLVKYRANHNVHDEWVYNRANIDAAKIVWARSIGDEGDEELLEYFSDRTLWQLDADAKNPSPRRMTRPRRIVSIGY
jgi:hypothetical protein